MKCLRRLEGLLVALGSLLWFCFLMPWGSFTDPDAFYHAHVARLMLDHGPLKAFPWLDLTTVGQHFVDQHFLFHVTLIPVIALMRWLHPGDAFAEFWGSQIMAVILGTLTVMILWMVLKRLDEKRAWFWIIVTLVISSFSMRMMLAKASPIAVGCFVVVIGIVALCGRDTRDSTSSRSIGRATARPYGLLGLALTGLVFALAHGGWIIAILGLGLMLGGDVLLRWLGEDEPFWQAIKHAQWMELISLCVGIAVGLLLHPNRDELMRFLWVQVVRIGVLSPANVVPGREWLPSPILDLIGTLAPLIIPLMIALWAIAFGARKLQTRDSTSGVFPIAYRRVILLAFPVALTLALTLKSRRFSEYLAPSLVLWVASLWALVDTDRLKTLFRETIAGWPKIVRPIAPWIGLLLAIWVAVHSGVETWTALRGTSLKPFDTYRQTLQAISDRAHRTDLATDPHAPVDRVFHSDWDEFPQLFAADDRLKYVSGLDPVFLYDANPNLSDNIRNLTLGLATSTAWDVIVNQTGSRFVFVTTKRHPGFNAALQLDPRFRLLSQNSDTAAYEAISIK